MPKDYVNPAREERVDGSGAKSDGAHGSGSISALNGGAAGSGKIKSAASGGEGASAAFQSADSMLGLPDAGALPGVSGVEVAKGSGSVPEVALDKGSQMVGESNTSKVGKAA